MTGKQAILLVLFFSLYTVGIEKISYDKYQERLVVERMFAREDAYSAGFADGNNKATKTFYDNLSNSPEINRLFLKYFTNPKEAKFFRALMFAESLDGNVIHKNNDGSLDCGIFGINTIHKDRDEDSLKFCKRMLGFEENFKLATQIYKKQGSLAWVTYKTGAFKKYLQ